MHPPLFLLAVLILPLSICAAPISSQRSPDDTSVTPQRRGLVEVLAKPEEAPPLIDPFSGVSLDHHVEKPQIQIPSNQPPESRPFTPRPLNPLTFINRLDLIDKRMLYLPKFLAPEDAIATTLQAPHSKRYDSEAIEKSKSVFPPLVSRLDLSRRGLFSAPPWMPPEAEMRAGPAEPKVPAPVIDTSFDYLHPGKRPPSAVIEEPGPKRRPIRPERPSPAVIEEPGPKRPAIKPNPTRLTQSRPVLPPYQPPHVPEALPMLLPTHEEIAAFLKWDALGRPILRKTPLSPTEKGKAPINPEILSDNEVAAVLRILDPKRPFPTYRGPPPHVPGPASPPIIPDPASPPLISLTDEEITDLTKLLYPEHPFPNQALPHAPQPPLAPIVPHPPSHPLIPDPASPPLTSLTDEEVAALTSLLYSEPPFSNQASSHMIQDPASPPPHNPDTASPPIIPNPASPPHNPGPVSPLISPDAASPPQSPHPPSAPIIPRPGPPPHSPDPAAPPITPDPASLYSSDTIPASSPHSPNSASFPHSADSITSPLINPALPHPDSPPMAFPTDEEIMAALHPTDLKSPVPNPASPPMVFPTDEEINGIFNGPDSPVPNPPSPPASPPLVSPTNEDMASFMKLSNPGHPLPNPASPAMLTDEEINGFFTDPNSPVPKPASPPFSPDPALSPETLLAHNSMDKNLLDAVHPASPPILPNPASPPYNPGPASPLPFIPDPAPPSPALPLPASPPLVLPTDEEMASFMKLSDPGNHVPNPAQTPPMARPDPSSDYWKSPDFKNWLDGTRNKLPPHPLSPLLPISETHPVVAEPPAPVKIEALMARPGRHPQAYQDWLERKGLLHPSLPHPKSLPVAIKSRPGTSGTMDKESFPLLESSHPVNQPPVAPLRAPPPGSLGRPTQTNP